MRQPHTSSSKTRRSVAIPETVFAIIMIFVTLSYQAVHASTLLPNAYRVSVAGDKFSDTWQVAATFLLRAPRRIRARQLELAVGAVSTSNENRAFVSFGPVWRLPIADRRPLQYQPRLGHDRH